MGHASTSSSEASKDARIREARIREEGSRRITGILNEFLALNLEVGDPIWTTNNIGASNRGASKSTIFKGRWGHDHIDVECLSSHSGTRRINIAEYWPIKKAPSEEWTCDRCGDR